MTIYVNGLYLGELEPSVTVAGCVEIFENVWPNPQETIHAIEQESLRPNSGLYWQRAETIGAGPKQNARTNDMMGISHLAEIANNPVAQNIHNQFYTTLCSASNSYAKRFGIQEQFYHEPYSLLRYKGGEHYKAHYDGGTNIGRCVSALCYLNNDYEGGEIEFVNFKVKIKPEPGMMILFPSNYAYMHIAHPVTSGTKYTMVTWIKDRAL